MIKNTAREIKGQRQVSTMLIGTKDVIQFNTYSNANIDFSTKEITVAPKPYGSKAMGTDNKTAMNKMAKIGIANMLVISPAMGNVLKVTRTIPAVMVQRKALESNNENLLGNMSIQPMAKAESTDNFQPTSHTNQGLHRSKHTAARLTA